MHYKLALLGFGNVGRAFAELLLQKEAELQTKYNLTLSVTGIATARHGIAINPLGIDLREALKAPQMEPLSQAPIADRLSFIRACNAHVLFENSPVNYETGQPAVDHAALALECGMHVITANKGTVVHAYDLLRRLAEEKKRRFLFESIVMDGAPIFSLFRGALPGANLLSFRAVLNSTTNLILTRMENGESFDDAVRHAQQIGIAETDPSGDIEGWDSAVKVSALATVLMGAPLKPANIERTGIRGITPQMIHQARGQGKRYKLVCSAEKQGGTVRGMVAPMLVDSTSPMYGIEGTTSLIEFHTDVLGNLTLIENDPSPATTAYGLLADLLNIAQTER